MILNIQGNWVLCEKLFRPREEVVFCLSLTVNTETNQYTSLGYSYCEKGCRKKCTRQSRKVLWVVWVHSSTKKFERMAREAMDICLRVLKESKKSRFDSYSARNSVLIISRITFRDCRVHFFYDNLSRNSCIQNRLGKLWVWNSPGKRSGTTPVSYLYRRLTQRVW